MPTPSEENATTGSSAAAATPKGERTRRRIIDAALAEFAEHGIAGARVDRIAAAARTNKAQLYTWFGSKDALFDAVFDGEMDGIVEAVPVDGEDLADWAVRLYDDYLAHPERIRLATWSRLERRPTGHLYDDHAHREAGKVAAIAAAQDAGLVREGEPFDLMALVIAMSMAWSPVSNVYAATTGESAGEHDRRRTLLRAAVTAAVAAPGPT